MSSGRPHSSTTSQSDRSINRATTNTASGAGSNTSNIEANTDEANRAFDYTVLSDGPGTVDNLATIAATTTINQHDTSTAAANTAASTATRATASSVPVEKQLSPFDATIHLLKGNLGT